MVSTTSNITTRNLYIESREESLVAAKEYVTKEHNPAPDKTDLVALQRVELYAQCKLFDLIMKQISDILVAITKGSSSGGGGGSSGGSRRGHDCRPKKLCPYCNNMVVHAAADCFTLPANKDNIPSWYKPPKTD
jgi:hypothetical protein